MINPNFRLPLVGAFFEVHRREMMAFIVKLNHLPPMGFDSSTTIIFPFFSQTTL